MKHFIIIGIILSLSAIAIHAESIDIFYDGGSTIFRYPDTPFCLDYGLTAEDSTDGLIYINYTWHGDEDCNDGLSCPTYKFTNSTFGYGTDGYVLGRGPNIRYATYGYTWADFNTKIETNSSIEYKAIIAIDTEDELLYFWHQTGTDDDNFTGFRFVGTAQPNNRFADPNNKEVRCWAIHNDESGNYIKDVIIYGMTKNQSNDIEFRNYQETFDSRRIRVTLETITRMDYIEYSINDKRWSRFCSRCKSDMVDKSISFDEGFNKVEFRSFDYDDNLYEAEYEFMVDSKKPRIYNQEPRNKAYGNGSFSIIYSEENLKDIAVLIAEEDNDDFSVVAERDDCPASKRDSCTLEIDNIAIYDGMTMQYKFRLTDLVNVVESRRPYEITFDISPPEFDHLLLTKTSDTREKYEVEVVLNEKVRTIEYNTPDLSRARRICSNCDERDRNLYFRYRPSYIDIIATDYAGNIAEERLYP